MKHIPVLRQYPDHAFNIGDLEYEIDEHILSIPALPFIMLNLKENANKVIAGGWEFYAGNIRFFITGEQMHFALARYLEEQKHIPIERFMDPYGQTN